MNSFIKISFISLLTIAFVQCKTQIVSDKKENTTDKTEEHDHSSHSHDNDTEHEHLYMAKPTEADTMTTKGFNALYFSYFKLTAALSNDNKTKAADYAGSIYRTLDNIKSEQLSVKTGYSWQVRKPLIKKLVSNIANSAENLDKQRSYISQLSINLFELMRTNKLESPVYLFFCSTSNDSEGGSWLSKENNTNNNPYQNNTPEPCGFIAETIK